jgi:hypothetical protein
MPELLARREVVQEGPGYFVLGPMMSRLVEFVESRLLQVADHMHAVPYRFPALISPAYLEKVKYFQNFPHSLSFVTHLREDFEIIQKFSSIAATRDGTVATNETTHATCRAMLSPAVCHHLYFSLSDSEIDSAGLVATASGHCFRYESINMVSLERIWNFTMREIIFVGTDEQTKAWPRPAQSTTAWMSAYSIIERSCMLSPMPKRGRLPAAMNVLMQSTLPSPIEYGASSSIDVTNHPSCCAVQSISREDRSASWLFARRFPAKRSQSKLEQRSPLKNR